MILKACRILPVAAALAIVFGCHGEDGGHDGVSDTGTGVSVFTEDFSNGFPGSNWIIQDGSPLVVADLGNDAPALVIGPSLEDTRISSSFSFSSSEALNLSFQLAVPLEPAEGAFFRFIVVGDDLVAGETSAEVGPAAGQMRLRLLGEEQLIIFVSNGGFHTIEFVVDAAGVATWFVDGLPAMTRASFPHGHFRMEMAGRAASTDGFVVDNVTLKRP